MRRPPGTLLTRHSSEPGFSGALFAIAAMAVLGGVDNRGVQENVPPDDRPPRTCESDDVSGPRVVLNDEALFLFEQDVPLSEQLSGVGVEDQFAAVPPPSYETDTPRRPAGSVTLPS